MAWHKRECRIKAWPVKAPRHESKRYSRPHRQYGHEAAPPRAAEGKSKMLGMIPSLLQVIGILHLSAMCARASTVTGTVPGATPAQSTYALTGRLTADGPAIVVVARKPPDTKHAAAKRQSTSPAAFEKKERAQALAPAALAAGVNTTLARRRSERKAASGSRIKISPWDKRRMVLSLTRQYGVARTDTTAFAAPPVASAHRCQQSQRPRGSRHRCRLSQTPLSQRGASFTRVSVGSSPIAKYFVSTRKRPLTMTTPAAAVVAATAAAAVAAVASRVSLPSGDRVVASLGTPLSARSAGTVAPKADEPIVERSRTEGGAGDNGALSDLNGRAGLGVFLYSLVRWVLTVGGLLRINRGSDPTPALSGMSMKGGGSRGGGGSGGGGGGGLFQGLFSWWRVFDGPGRRVKDPERSTRSGGNSSGSNSGGVMPRPTASAVEQQQQQQQSKYPRPQSTAYPRPQSTAYPRPQSTAYARPQVYTRTLLDLGADDSSPKPLPPKKERTAMVLAGGSSDTEDVHADGQEDNPLLSKFLCWFFARVITSRAKLVEGLEVRVDARSNREAMSGLLQAVGITFNHLELENLQISGGATVRITGLDLKVMTLLWRRFRSFKKPFEVAGSYVFTSGDLASSPMVRSLVENMMNATLRKLETLATDPLSLSKSIITIMKVTAKRSRLVIDGEMMYDNVRVPFNYRTSIGVKGKGHIVYLKDPEVFWENVGGSLSLPLLPLQTFDIDIGDGARIESIRIVSGQVAVRARFVLSPFPPLVVASMLKRASFRYDVGEKLSVVFGNFVERMKILRVTR